MKSKGELMNNVVIHIILIGLILALFLMATADKINSRGVRQQVLEKEVALLIDSASSGMTFEIRKVNINGIVNDVKVSDGRIYIGIENLPSISGYPYFSKYSIGVEETSDKFIVKVR